MTSSGAVPRGKQVKCKVLLLDDTMPTFQVSYKAHGCDLFDAVVKHLRLLESDYFGLEYKDATGVLRWLDNEKYIVKQTGSQHDMSFRFSVKFYTPDPGLLEEEFTRYLFALQVKRDLASGSMPCNMNTAALLSAYIAQAEIGDYNYEEFTDYTYLSSIRFVPNQSNEMEEKIAEHHKNLIGHTPADADYLLLDTARKVETYGVVLHPARDHEGVPLYLSVAHMGVLVFQNNTKINTFSWAKIRKLSFKRKRFLIKLHPEGYDYYKDTVDFFFDTRDDCKAFWKKCIEHHAFFRCASIKRAPRNKTRVISRGSSFRYSGRTQKQLTDHVRENFVRRPGFERRYSNLYLAKENTTTSVRVSSRSIGAKSNRSATLNSANASQRSLSSGSHILDDRPHDDGAAQQPSSRIETVEVHSDSSHSGSVALAQTAGVVSSQSDGGLVRRTVADVHVLDKSSHSDGQLANENDTNLDLSVQSANQNANDNAEAKHSVDDGERDQDNPGHLTVLHIDEDELMNRKNTSLNNNSKDTKNNAEVDNLGVETLNKGSVQNDIDHKTKIDTEPLCTHKTADVESMDDIDYVLHRRPVESVTTTTITITNTSKVSPAKPASEFSTFRAPPVTQPSITNVPAPADSNKVKRDSSLSSPGVSPSSVSSISPKSPRQRFDFVKLNKLPKKDSYSSADDTVSPPYENEVLTQFETKIKQRVVITKEEKSITKVEETTPAEKPPMTFSTFLPPPVITTQAPTPTTPPPSQSCVDASLGTAQRSFSSSSSSGSESDSEDEGEEAVFVTDESQHVEVLANPFLFGTKEGKKPLVHNEHIAAVGACVASSTPIKGSSPGGVTVTYRFQQQQQSYSVKESPQEVPPASSDLRPKSNIEDFFFADGSSPIPFADDSPVPSVHEKDSDEDLPSAPEQTSDQAMTTCPSPGVSSFRSPGEPSPVPCLSTFRPVTMVTTTVTSTTVSAISPIKERGLSGGSLSASSELETSQEESKNQLECLENLQHSRDGSTSSSDSSQSSDGCDRGDGLTPVHDVPPVTNGGFYSNPYADSNFNQVQNPGQDVPKYTFSSFGR